MKPQSIPPRIHILLSRDGASGVIFRRGPSKQVCTIGWDRINDRFTLGQWLKGTLYERRCDLSPNGKYLIYFAMKGGETYTAISFAPYIKALALWGNCGTWGGGGYFIDNVTVAVTTTPSDKPDKYQGFENLRPKVNILASDPYAETYGWFGWEDPGRYYPRLLRDGWTLIEKKELIAKKTYVTIFDKPLKNGWVLRKLAYATSTPRRSGQGSYYDEHQLMHFPNNELIDYPEWEWADYDGRRLMWVEAGILSVGKITKSGLYAIKAIHDFNGMTFEARIAPY
jgi:hypothetical protein